MVTVEFLWEKLSQPQFRKDLTRKTAFFRGLVLLQIPWFGTGIRCKLEFLHQCGKKVKTKSQKVLGASSYVCRSYRGKTGRGGCVLFASPHLLPWIGLRKGVLKISRKFTGEHRCRSVISIKLQSNYLQCFHHRLWCLLNFLMFHSYQSVHERDVFHK